MNIASFSKARAEKKFLFISKDNEGGDIAWQIKKEGNEVKFWTSDHAEDKESFEGFIERVDSWEPHKDWADVIVIDDKVGEVIEIEVKISKSVKLKY